MLRAEMRHRPKHVIEYAALRAVHTLVNLLPYRGALVLGWLVGGVAFGLARGRVREAQRRIAEVFGDRFSPAERRRLAWRSWRNMVFTGVELLRIGTTDRRRLKGMDIEYAAIADTLLAQVHAGQGGIVAVPHMGNWELAAAICRWNGVPIFSIAGRQRNPLTNAFIDRLRERPGIVNVTRGAGTMKQVIRRLRQGEFLAILPDVRIPQPGLSAPFLGGTANVGPGMALFAWHARVPLFTGYVVREGWTRQVYHVGPPLIPDPTQPKDAEISRLILGVMHATETAIRTHPDQWFWFNRRWILEPLAPTSNPEPISERIPEPGPHAD